MIMKRRSNSITHVFVSRRWIDRDETRTNLKENRMLEIPF